MTKEDITMKKSILCYLLNHFNVNYDNLKNKLDRKEQKVWKKKDTNLSLYRLQQMAKTSAVFIEKLQVFDIDYPFSTISVTD